MIVNEHAETIEVGIFELLLAVVKRKRFVFTITLSSAILATIICFVMPLKWESKALISPIADNTASIQLNADLLNNLSSLPIIGSQKMDEAVDMITIMDSRSFRESIIRKFNLIKYFKIDKPDSSVAMEIALDKMNKGMLSIFLEQQSNTIQLSVLTKDKYLSKQIAEYEIQSLDYNIKHQKRLKSRLTREFLEKRTADVKSRLDSLMVLNKKYDSSEKTYSIDEQTTQALSIYSDLVSEKLKNDIDLELAYQQYGKTSPKVAELESKKILVANQIRDFENNHSGTLPKYILKLEDLPDVSMQRNKIQVDLKIMNDVYEYLYPIMESSRLNELKDMPSLDVMDKPSLAGRHTSPKRLLLILLCTFAALLLASIISILNAFMPLEQKQYLKAIMNEFRKKSQSNN